MNDRFPVNHCVSPDGHDRAMHLALGLPMQWAGVLLSVAGFVLTLL